MKEERSQELAEKAVKLADLWIRKRLPWLGGALMVPVNEWLESDVSGTDGFSGTRMKSVDFLRRVQQNWPADICIFCFMGYIFTLCGKKKGKKNSGGWHVI